MAALSGFYLTFLITINRLLGDLSFLVNTLSLERIKGLRLNFAVLSALEFIRKDFILIEVSTTFCHL
jgi:hypothetical protein|tara:strand:+ start:155 stop:355 length:201 start_codon:yes stop_codon:yes gene_type:complete